MRGFMTDNNGLWIGWLDLLALLLQLQPIIGAHNRWLSKTEYKSPCLTVPLLFCFSCVYSLPQELAYRTVAQQWIIPCLFVAAGTCLASQRTSAQAPLFRLSGVMSHYKIHFVPYRKQSHVEAGSNTSTVALRVVGGDKTGSLESETVKYGRKSHGTRTREWPRWLNHRPVLSSERVAHINKPATVWQ
jgi:hypothetical protein